MEEEKYCQVALTRVGSVGYVHAKLLLEHFGSAKAIFSASVRELQAIEGIGPQRARQIREYAGFPECQKLVQQSEAKGIRLIGYGDPGAALLRFWYVFRDPGSDDIPVWAREVEGSWDLRQVNDHGRVVSRSTATQ